LEGVITRWLLGTVGEPDPRLGFAAFDQLAEGEIPSAGFIQARKGRRSRQSKAVQGPAVSREGRQKLVRAWPIAGKIEQL